MTVLEHDMFGTRAVYETIFEEEARVRVRVISAPGLLPGDRIWLTKRAADAMTPARLESPGAATTTTTEGVVMSPMVPPAVAEEWEGINHAVRRIREALDQPEGPQMWQDVTIAVGMVEVHCAAMWNRAHTQMHLAEQDAEDDRLHQTRRSGSVAA